MEPFDHAAYQRQWRKANPDKVRQSYVKYINSPKGQALLKRFYESGAASRSRNKYAKSYRGMLQRVVRRAEKRHLVKWPHEPFTLTHGQIIDLWKSQAGLCALSGIEMTWGQREQKPTSLSIDRIDSKCGYHLDNIRLICHSINAFRGAGTDAEMMQIARAIVAWADDDIPTVAIAA